jgi:hypothetical protein
MMYDPLMLDRQRQQQAALRRRAACGPVPAHEPKAPREARHRRGVMRRLASVASSS